MVIEVSRSESEGKLVIEGSRNEPVVKSDLALKSNRRNIPAQIAEASAGTALRNPIEVAVSESDIVKWGGAFGTQSIAAGVSASWGVRKPLDQVQGSTIRKAIERWPAAIGFKQFPDRKAAILDAAIFDRKKILQSKVYFPKGQDLVPHQQVEQFMNMEQRHPTQKREQLAIHIANGFKVGTKLANRIMQ